MKHLTFGCLIVVSVAVARTVAADDVQRPNILFILVDDVGREVLGCYGGQSYPTPNIDRLAHEGMRFEYAHVMPMCHPTRICLLTGQYPFRLGALRWGTFPRSFEPNTLANMLKSAGYATGISGKWQLTLLKDDLQQPHRMGFEEYCLDAWHEGPWYYQPRIWQDGKLRTDVGDLYGPDVTCDYLIEFLRRHRHAPFFALYTMELCHDETNDLKTPAPFGPLGRYENYSEMVAQMDRRVGRVIDELEALKLRERTLVLVLSDNGTPPQCLVSAKDGEYIFEPFTSKMNGREVRGGKGTLTDRGIRVPMIASWPGTIEPGQVSDALVDASDVLPTLATIAGATLPAGSELDGQSFVAKSNKRVASRRWIFAEYNGRFCVRNRRWKLFDDGRFYDMDSDPNEEQPIAISAIPADAQSSYAELGQALHELGYPDQK